MQGKADMDEQQLLSVGSAKIIRYGYRMTEYSDYEQKLFSTIEEHGLSLIHI